MILAAVLLATKFELQSNFWVSLHQRLRHESIVAADTITTTSDADRAEWNRVVETYRTRFGQKSPWLDPELIAINDALTNTRESDSPHGIPDAVRDALVRAAPIYRRTQWTADDQTNHFWIAEVEGMLRETQDELVREHERVYGLKWPQRMRVDAAPNAGPVGAYTTGDTTLGHTTVESDHRNYRCFSALEMLLHESSHAVFDEELVSNRAKVLGVAPPRDLWHAILFYTSGELTKRALAARGVTDYRPTGYVVGVYTRGEFPRYLPLLETIWQQHIDGKISRDDAIDSMLRQLTSK